MWETHINPMREFVVTYFLGNGFDIGLGLNTRYTDFIKAYVIPKPDDSLLITNFRKYIQRDIAADIATWSDAEKRFGELPFTEFAKESGLSVEQAIRDLDSSFQQELAIYLRREEGRFQIPGEKAVTMRDNIVKHMMWALRHTKGSGTRLDCGIGDVELNFITLNYTRTLNQWFSRSGNIEQYIKFRDDDTMSRVFCGDPRGVRMGETRHPHGSLFSYGYRLFGVNDISQIKDVEAKEVCSQYGYLIKTEEDRLTNVGDRAAAEKLIERSNILVLFGTSYGATDRYWWETIRNKVEADPEFKVVLSPYVPNTFPARAPCDDIYRAKQEREKFFAGIDPESARDLADKYEANFFVISHGPYDATDKSGVFCDPLYLRDYRSEFLKDDIGAVQMDAVIAEIQSAQKTQFQDEAIGRLGQVRFDYTRNNGHFKLTVVGESFDTQWSPCGPKSVYAYCGKNKRLGQTNKAVDWPLLNVKPELYDWSSDYATINVGQIFLLQKNNGKIIAIYMKDVKNKDRGADCNELNIEYCDVSPENA